MGTNRINQHSTFFFFVYPCVLRVYEVLMLANAWKDIIGVVSYISISRDASNS
jgi:hypothetical protein